MPHFDTSAFGARLDQSALAAYQHRLPSSIRPSLRAIWQPAITLSAGVTAFTAMSIWLLLSGRSISPSDAIAAVGLLTTGTAVVLSTVVNVVRDLRLRGGERQFRLWRFATANQLTYLPVSPPPDLPGMIFAGRDSQVAFDWE